MIRKMTQNSVVLNLCPFSLWYFFSLCFDQTLSQPNGIFSIFLLYWFFRILIVFQLEEILMVVKDIQSQLFSYMVLALKYDALQGGFTCSILSLMNLFVTSSGWRVGVEENAWKESDARQISTHRSCTMRSNEWVFLAKNGVDLLDKESLSLARKSYFLKWHRHRE